MPVQEFLTPRGLLLCKNIVQMLQQQKGEKSFIALLPSTIQHALLSTVQK